MRFVCLYGIERYRNVFLNLTLQSTKGDITASRLLGKPVTVEIAVTEGGALS